MSYRIWYLEIYGRATPALLLRLVTFTSSMQRCITHTSRWNWGFGGWAVTSKLTASKFETLTFSFAVSVKSEQHPTRIIPYVISLACLCWHSIPLLWHWEQCPLLPVGALVTVATLKRGKNVAYIISSSSPNGGNSDHGLMFNISSPCTTGPEIGYREQSESSRENQHQAQAD